MKTILLTVITCVSVTVFPPFSEAQYLESESLVFKSGTEKTPDQHGVRQYRIPHITTGPDGEMVVSVAGRTHVAGDNIYISAPLGPGRTNGVVYLSQDLGATWKVHHNMKADAVFGYSSLTLLNNGRIGVLAEQKSDNKNLLDQVFSDFPAAKK